MGDVDLSVDVTPIKRFSEAVGANADKAWEKMQPFVLAATAHTMGRIARKTPVDTGALRSSWFSFVRVQRFNRVAVIKSPLIYALPVERGVKGTKRTGLFMARDGLKESTPKIISLLTRGMKAAVKAVFGEKR